MFPLKFIRENKERVKEGIRKKNMEIDIEGLLSLDDKRRELIKKTDDMRARQNKLTKEVSEKKRRNEDPKDIIDELKDLKSEIARNEEELKKIEEEIDKILIWIPNIPHISVPEEKKIIYQTDIKKFDFEVKDHLILCKAHNIIDFEAGAKIAGSNFPLYKGKGATLERALINFMLELHTKEHNYTEIFPPFLAREECMFGTGQLPKLKEDMYLIEQDNLYLNPTAEVPLTNIVRDEILDGDILPLKFTGYTACFRREAGSYGKETKGLMRLHQFNKVELVKIVKPENSYDELESLLNDAVEVVKRLGLPYRIVLLPYNDISFASAKTYDIEVFSPGLNRWLEVSSVSNFEDFQARRANIRFRNNGKTEFVHTLNGSGIATPRTFCAIIENYQKKDGSIEIPEVLRKYTGFDRIP
uniref:Serine--tRNA ligase n=1 Tax=candidate division WOR-3 bacterium TaxID=2052148 RepID=A0A7C4UBS9_UNCW3